MRTVGTIGAVVAEANPLKQGLKLSVLLLCRVIAVLVAEANPLKQGLKPKYVITIPRYVSWLQRLIH